MNIWTRLGVSVALAAMFYIAMAEFVQKTLFYLRQKWYLCGSFIVAGAAIVFVGRWINRRMMARYLNAQAALAEQDRDQDHSVGQPFFLFNVAFWGVMFVIFGCITIFIVPTYSEGESVVAARNPEPAPPRAKAAPPPELRLQGVVLRDGNSSAIINGRTYFVGDVVQEARVREIRTNEVMLEWRGVKLVLPAPK